MEQVFISIYHYFLKRKAAFWAIFLSAWAVLGITASRIHLEEDITRFFPDDKRVEKLDYVFRNARFAERLVFMVSVADSATAPQPDSLVAYSEALATAIQERLAPYVKAVNSQVDDQKVLSLVNATQQHLPLFLEEHDYRVLDSLISPGVVKATLAYNYRQLISPAGMVTKKIIATDPLGFSFLVLKKLQQLQYDNNVEVYDNRLVSKDRRHLVFFVEPVFKPVETRQNTPFIDGLDQIINELAPAHAGLKASYFGATAVAVGNARQLQRDTVLTISLMLVLLAVFLVGFFRKKRVPFLIMIPVAFGALFSLSCVYIIQGYISIIAVAAGSIILGIAINYSLHFLSHLKHTGDIATVIKDLVKPMTMGSATTVLAFFCLQFVNAAVLRDLGLFAAFSLVGAALCSLLFLPQLISTSLWKKGPVHESWIERVSLRGLDANKYLVTAILLLTPVFLYFAGQVSFNTDLGQLNFMNDEVREAQQRLESINKASLSSIYVVAQAGRLEEALQKNERTTASLRQLQQHGKVQKYASVSTFIISDSLQRLKIARWQKFWSEEKVKNLMLVAQHEGEQLRFSPRVFANLESLLTRNYQPAGDSLRNIFREAFFGDYIIEKHGLATVITLANVAPEQKQEVYRHLERTPSNAFDRQMLTNLFAEYVHADFNFIVTFTSILVFIALLLSYGRIELTLITFIPMMITWVWILGIMALAGIEFNIVNVMISTFIFGLGDDYSIFTMDGLLQEYRVGTKNLSSIRTSIFLSALTTISGLGVLIFAQHPALRSIAGISIIGIVCVFIMSQTIAPCLFRWLITNRASRAVAPMSLWGMCKTAFLFGFFMVGSFFLTAVGLILKLIPFSKGKVRLLYHTLISAYTRTLLNLGWNIDVRTIGKTATTFSRPSVLISNHTSFLDILVTVVQHPRLILITSKWVWNSPVFGGVVRLADYYPVTEGAEDSIERLKNRVEEGYSVVVFPEGTRSPDGNMKRFHKGAFYMAEQLNLPVQPLIIHGAGPIIPKGDFYINKGIITLKYLPPIEPGDAAYGTGYAERTKRISRYFKEEYGRLTLDEVSPLHFKQKLITNYLYKGPVLEWYMRIKLKLEKYYTPFEKLVPRKAKVLDLGCGYGFLCYMLYFMSEAREVTGVDYDEEKIAVANTGYAKTDRINFMQGDITQFPVAGYDVIIIADVLHYLTPEAQEATLVNCFRALPEGGRLIIREGNADLKERHRGTRLTEFFSVRLLKFNKSTNDLHFISGENLTRLASQHGLTVEVVDDTRFTSNIIFVISRRS